jgi:hypothetical protein
MVAIMEKVYGFILKKEFITTVQKNILPGTFVLKIGKPFPGIYKGLKIRNIPEFYFLVLGEHYPAESIIRASEEINKKCRHGFNAVAGEITVSGECYPVIRIKNIEEEGCIDELQTMYQEKGFTFNTSPVQIGSSGMVKIIKYFSLEKVGEGLYFDAQVPELGYFEIPRKIEWDAFEEMTSRIRIDVALGTFDAAIGMFYRRKKEVNIVRIFNPMRSIINLGLLKKEYLQVLHNKEYTDQKVY